MLSSYDLQNLQSSDFSRLYQESYISSLVKQITCLCLEEAFIKNTKLFVYDLKDLVTEYHSLLLEMLKNEFKVSSIYIRDTRLFIDWSTLSA